VALSDGYLIIHELTPAGKKRMSGEDFVRGFMGK
jgi:methionyl-tRNA formyltransferase